MATLIIEVPDALLSDLLNIAAEDKVGLDAVVEDALWEYVGDAADEDGGRVVDKGEMADMVDECDGCPGCIPSAGCGDPENKEMPA